MSVNNNKFFVGTKVFAKVRNYPPWPAVVKSIENCGKNTKYNVLFFHTKDTAKIKEADLFLYSQYKHELGIPKTDNYRIKKFNIALQEAELDQSEEIPNKSTDSNIQINSETSSIESGICINYQITDIEDHCGTACSPERNERETLRRKLYPFIANECETLNNSLEEIASNLSTSTTLITSEAEQLEIAAKLGAVLLEKNKLLDKENSNLLLKLSSVDAKLEELETNEVRYLEKIENLLQNVAEITAQLVKEKQLSREMQNIFEEQDNKQRQLIDDYIKNIWQLEKSISILQNNKIKISIPQHYERSFHSNRIPLQPLYQSFKFPTTPATGSLF